MRRLRAVMILAAALAAAGCGRRTSSGAGSGETDWRKKKPPELPVEYSLARRLDPEMEGLAGIALGREGRLYAVGRGGVSVLDSAGSKIGGWEAPETARAVAVGEDGLVYVALASKVRVHDGSGRMLREWGEIGSGPGQMKLVTAIDVSGSGVFIADAGNRCVHRFAVNGDFVATFGRRDPEAGEQGFHIPSPHFDVALDAEGLLHVTNPGYQRVEIRGENGELRSHWGRPGFDLDRFCGCCNPTDIALLPGGRTVTSEKGINRIKVYDAGGRMISYISPEHFPEHSAGLDLAVDAEGRIYVAEPVNSEVFVFEPKE